MGQNRDRVGTHSGMPRWTEAAIAVAAVIAAAAAVRLPLRPSRRALAILLGMIAAAGFLTSCASPHDGHTAPARSGATNAAVVQRRVPMAGETVIVVNCLNKEQARPSSYVLTCADANDYLTGLHWVSWGSAAFGTGTEIANTCAPTCVQGKFISYPALVVFWRPEPLPDHPGVLYFTRITRIYTSGRPPLYTCQGTRTCYPVTSTQDLWSRTG